MSDGLLVAGTDGLILQVKSRSQSEAISDTVEKAESWCLKKGIEAQSQAYGTWRTLMSSKIRVRSLRGFDRTLPNASDWLSVVILDHPGAASVSFPPSVDTLFISLNDWLNLHRMVRSTAGVVTYVRRALASGLAVPLGQEANRYKQLAAADLAACDSITAFPTLPPIKLGDREKVHVALVDDLIEKVADRENSGFDPEHYLQIVEQLDGIPLIGRVRLGAMMERTLRAMHQAKGRRSFMSTDSNSGGVYSGDRLGFVYDYYDFETHGIGGQRFTMDVSLYAMLRQQQALEAGADPASATLAVGLLHHPQLGNKYQFAWVSGTPPQMPADIRANLEDVYGIFDGRSARPRQDPAV